MNGQAELDKGIYTCAWHGPDHCDTHLMDTLKQAEIEKPELLVYMLHGLDDEGWGPIHAKGLESALDYCIASDSLEISHL
jgi:hypothetical protein